MCTNFATGIDTVMPPVSELSNDSEDTDVVSHVVYPTPPPKMEESGAASSSGCNNHSKSPNLKR